MPAMSVWLRRAATAVAASRVGVGVVAFAVPEVVSRSWVGRPADGPSAPVLGRALGGRDLALGLGALVALRLQATAGTAAVWDAASATEASKPDPGVAGGPAAAIWVGLAALADGLDLVTTAHSWGDLPRLQRWLVALASGGAAAVGVVATVSLLVSPVPPGA